LIVGGNSLLGTAVAQLHRSQGDVVRVTTRRSGSEDEHLDLSDLQNWRPACPYDVAYICAAATSLAACEADPSRTSAINVSGIVEICRRLTEQGIFSVVFSTNLVFDGEQPHVPADAPHAPRCEYGRQKSAMEHALRAAGCQTAILRLTKVIGPDQQPFSTWAARLAQGLPVEAFADMDFAPVWLEDAAGACVALGRRGIAETAQLSGMEDISYRAAAVLIADAVGAEKSLVSPVGWRDRIPNRTQVPRYTSLASSETFRQFTFSARNVIDRLLAVRNQSVRAETATR
jgi:dTDP-4-dehydrorhamnose reductase